MTWGHFSQDGLKLFTCCLTGLLNADYWAQFMPIKLEYLVLFKKDM